MARRNRDQDGREPRGDRGSDGGGGFLSSTIVSYLTLAGVGVVILLNAKMFSQGKINQQQLSDRMASLDKKIEAVSKNAAAQRPPSGPDPNKVYTIKTQGSPAEGPETAAVTIAEFSDFQ